jgi:hypothetical protein
VEREATDGGARGSQTVILPRIAFALGELAEGLVRIPLMKLGRFRKGTQVIPLTRQLISEVVSNFRKRKARGLDVTAGDVVVDYEHASESPEVALGGLVPAAGWLREVEDGPDANGILWGLIELTNRARAAVAARELRYTSPFIQAMKVQGNGRTAGGHYYERGADQQAIPGVDARNRTERRVAGRGDRESE